LPNHVRGRRVAIIGGGVVGCATAYLAARAGFQVTLLERDEIAFHASGRNPGNLNPFIGTQQVLVPRALDAFHLHARIRGELAELGCVLTGAAPMTRLLLGFTDSECASLDDTARPFAAHEGFSAIRLERAELRRIDSRIASDVKSGVLVQGNWSIDGREFSRALADGAMRLGGHVVREAAVGVTTHAGRVTAVCLHHGGVECDELVLATGPWIDETKAWLGIDVPIKPLKGEMLRLRMMEPPAHDLTWGATSIYRRGAGEVCVGTTMKDCGLDATPTAEAKSELLALAARIMPDIQACEVVEHLAAVRPMSEGMPIAERAHNWQNVLVANGGGPKGLLWSVTIGSTITHLLIERDATSPDRTST